MNKTKDKRQFVRVKSAFDVKIERDEVELSFLRMQIGNSIDISASGVLFTYNKPLDLGSVIRVSFLRPNSFNFFQGYAKVVRLEMKDNDNYEVGVKFLNLTTKDHYELDYYLSK